MRQRRLAGAILLGACLLLVTGRIHGQRWDTQSVPAQRQVIATSVTVATEMSSAPSPPVAIAPSSPPVAKTPDSPPVTKTVGSPPGAIQQVSYLPEPPSNGAAGQPPPPAPMVPPNVLQGMMSGAGARTASQPAETMAATLSVEVVGPDRIVLGKALIHEIAIRNTGTRRAAEVHVEEPLPEDVRVVKTEPPAVSRGNRLIWDLRNLEAGEERRLKIELNPGRPGELDLRPYLTFLSGNGLLTQVVRPPFGIEIGADRAKATRGERIVFNIQLANHGDAPIRNIKIYDKLPPELHHPMGPIMGITNFGDLMPGQTRAISLETTAVKSGPFHNEVIAQADRGVEATAAFDGTITEPSLSLRVDGPAKTLTQSEVDFYLEVVNPSALTAKQVSLVQALPPTFEVVSTSSGAALDHKLHALEWSLAELGAGQRQRVMFRIKANTPGDWPMFSAVQSQNFPEARVNCTLHAEAAAALRLDVAPPEDHLSVGAETVLRMHILNKGDAPCTGVRLTVALPEAVTPLKVEPSSGQIEQQQVHFAPLAQLDAHSDAVYCIHLRGRQAGKGSIRVQLTAEKQTPAERELSIQVNAADEKASAETVSESNKSASAETLR